ncbi:MAG: S41 family peptidase, partial [Candidatus Omnitrophota bacterium]
LFADAIALIEKSYVEEVENKDMIYGALDGMLSSLDSHSSFLDPDEYKQMKTETQGEFGGVGIKITMKDGVLTVISPLEDTPAYRVGIKSGDKIVEIDGESTDDFNLDDAVKYLRGVPGTKVKLRVIRKGLKEFKEFTIRRALIKIKSVKHPVLLEGGCGYIRIADFQQYTASDLEAGIKKLLKENMQSLIIDLRSNPGGLLGSAISVSEKFLHKGSIVVSTKGRIEEQNTVSKSMAFKPYLDFPIVVLINEGSASGSEIVAGALRDNNRSVLVGTKSFGKGSVQTVIPMRDGSAVRLTTSLYYTPSGVSINKVGIEPDLVVPYEFIEDDEDLSEEDEEASLPTVLTDEEVVEILLKDNQVIAAIDVLQNPARYNELLKKDNNVE